MQCGMFVRLLYGKMQAKSGKDTSGHKHVQMRKNMILRFLAGSQPGELEIFLDLVFQPFLHLVSGQWQTALRCHTAPPCLRALQQHIVREHHSTTLSWSTTLSQNTATPHCSTAPHCHGAPQLHIVMEHYSTTLSWSTTFSWSTILSHSTMAPHCHTGLLCNRAPQHHIVTEHHILLTGK